MNRHPVDPRRQYQRGDDDPRKGYEAGLAAGRAWRQTGARGCMLIPLITIGLSTAFLIMISAGWR